MNNWGRLAVFDLETTGVDTDTARIVSACVAVLDAGGEVIARWDWLADPGIEIPEGAAAVHGITTERARSEGRPAQDVVAEIAQTLRVLFSLDTPLVIYNAPYDLTLLDRECRRHGLAPLVSPAPVIDPLVLDKAVDKFRKGKRTLEVTTQLYGVALDDAHDAGSDAIAAGRVAQALARAYPEELDLPMADLHGRQEVWYAEQSASFTEYIRRVKGDEGFTSDSSWPVRPIDFPTSVVDTQPIPRPEPRPSLIVPYLDFETGTLELGPIHGRFELEATVVPIVTSPPHEAAQHSEQVAVRRAPALRVAVGIITDADGRALLVRRQGESAFEHAGGAIEKGESALDALSRAMRQTIGIELDLDATEYLGSFRLAGDDESEAAVRAEVFALTTTPALSPYGEVEQLIWVETDEPFGIVLSRLSHDTIMPLWMSRRAALF